MLWYRRASNKDMYGDREAFVSLFNEMPPNDLQMQIIRRDRDSTYSNGPRIWISIGGNEPTHYIVQINDGTFYVKGMPKGLNSFDRQSTMIFQEKGFKMQGDDLVYTKEESWDPPSVVKEKERWKKYW